VKKLIICTSAILITACSDRIGGPKPPPPPPPPAEQGKLNDTGIIYAGGNTAGNSKACASGTGKQDCSHGRDSIKNLGKVGGGHAGFDFTKLGANGQPLAIQNKSWPITNDGSESSGTNWACVKDNRTGLTWEIKQTEDGTPGGGGLHHADDKYAWEDNSNSASGNYNACSDIVANNNNCTTKNFVNAVNESNLCGSSSWRVPTRFELVNLVNYGGIPGKHTGVISALDTGYFPNVKYIEGYNSTTIMWSSNLSADSSRAWYVEFSLGYSNLKSTDYYGVHAMLVHD